ncbi:MAG: mechanosensitive ion channel domain-containing protein [Desulfosudaceae bacterium]
MLSPYRINSHNDRRNRPGHFRTLPRPTLFLCLILVMVIVLPIARAAAEQPDPPQPLEPNYSLLERSLDKVSAAEEKRLADLAAHQERLHRSRSSFQEWLNAYKLQLSAFRNFMALSEYDEYEMRQSGQKLQAALNHLQGRKSGYSEAMAELEKQQRSVKKRLALYQQEKTALRSQPDRKVTIRVLLQKKVNAVLDLLALQDEKIDKILEIYRQRQTDLETLYQSYQAVDSQFAEQADRQTRRWFREKTSSPLHRFDSQQMRTEALRLAEEIHLLRDAFTLQAHAVPDQQQYSRFVLTFVLLLAALMAGLLLLHRSLRRRRDAAWETGYFWQYLIFRMLRRALLMLGAILFIYFYPVPAEYRITPFFILMNLIAGMLLVMLPIRWGINYIRVMSLKAESFLFFFPTGLLRILLYGLLFFGTIYAVLVWGLGDSALLAGLWRLATEAAVLLWSIVFWNRFFRQPDQAAPAWWKAIKPVLPVAGYGFILFGFFCELLGYGGLAFFWFRSWILTLAVLMWAGILFMLLKEIDASIITPLSEETIEAESEAGEEEEDEETSTPVKWLIIRLCKIILLIVTILAVPAAWGGRKTMLMEMLIAVNYQLTLGKFQISLLDVIAALLFLLVLHTLVTLLKRILKENILARRHVEPGLQESIVTITGYLLWIIGLFIVLRIVGISAASLTVLFGAIGIGLGFGLQNIFNNFVSGIILLFERPIKVGDVIEINGIWGTVRKINVRSTQVRTYDNAELIIPNSDFISQQLTNWSFRDARVRRQIVVGVAYGSDTQLVKETLFNIAYNHPQVYKRPHPEVLFEDFGDSALIFKLRLWASIQYFLRVETDIRFEIDRQFRKLGITIPFPQRDVYIKEAGTGGARPLSPGDDSDSRPDSGDGPELSQDSDADGE